MGKALKSEHTYPPDFNLHSFVEAQNRHLTLCVAGGAERGGLQEALDRIFGHAAVNEVFPAALRVMGGRGVEDYVPGWRARV